MLMEKIQSSFLFGGNAPYVEEQYELYLADPASVADEWRAYFDALRETPAIDGSDRDWRGEVRYVSSEAAFTPYYALNERDRSRLAFLAEVVLTEPDAAKLPTGVPVEVTFPEAAAGP